ncbi:MAG: winged helix-turn-helix transcriptional regulator [Gammaproteobacteria bacterium]|nr:winged helix-turn-helix transcriptional regulator [Gammaproteobacteria bacterium]
MTPESQIVEWKSSWRDEYLKWICGFANAQGGVLEIGRNDCGEVVGVSDVDRLLEEIPNKVQSLLGIVVEVNLQSESGLEYLEIVVEPHPNPISYRGKFHYRTGSTKQVLEGAALTRLLLQKHGRTWDDVPLPGVDLDSLDGRVLADFRRRGGESERLPPNILGESDESVIEKLQLREAGLLKRAAVLLFHPAPHKFLMEAVVKIGYFRGSELLFQDVVEGDLFTQVKRTMDLLYTKYTRALISYDGLYRVETFPVPREAMREAVINAIIHRDYASATPIQIRVYDDRISMWNPAHLPPGWVTDQLAEELSSRPHNPRVAYAFFRAGMIEAWGRGIRRIVDICHEVGNPTPSWRLEAGGNGVWVRFPFSEAYKEADSAARGLAGDGATQEATRESGSARKLPEDDQKTTRKQPEGDDSSQNLADRIVSFLRVNPSASRREIAEALEGATEGSVRYHLDKLKRSGALRRVGPDRGGRWMVVDVLDVANDDDENDACAEDERTAGEAQPENSQKTARKDEEKASRETGDHHQERHGSARKQPEPRSLYDRILTLLRQNPSTSRREMAAALGTTRSTIRYRLDKLREGGKVERVGPDKGGYWKVLGDSGSEPDPDGESDPGSLS